MAEQPPFQKDGDHLMSKNAVCPPKSSDFLWLHRGKGFMFQHQPLPMWPPQSLLGLPTAVPFRWPPRGSEKGKPGNGQAALRGYTRSQGSVMLWVPCREPCLATGSLRQAVTGVLNTSEEQASHDNVRQHGATQLDKVVQLYASTSLSAGLRSTAACRGTSVVAWVRTYYCASDRMGVQVSFT